MHIPTFDDASFLRAVQRVFSIPRFGDDRYATPQALATLISRPNVIVLEFDNDAGYCFLEDVAPNGYGIAHIVVLRRRAIPDLDGTINALIKWAFSLFKLAYIAAWIPSTNRPAQRLMDRLGWNLDGHFRGLMVQYGQRVNAAVYSISREEALNGSRL